MRLLLLASDEELGKGVDGSRSEGPRAVELFGLVDRETDYASSSLGYLLQGPVGKFVGLQDGVEFAEIEY